MSKLVFSESFLNAMSEYLKNKTEGGHCITRTQLCKDLEVDLNLDGTIGSMIKLGYVSGYRIWMGPNGGIGRDDVKPPKKERETSTAATRLDNTDMAKILVKLDEYCSGGGVVSRKKLGASLGDSSIKMQNMISAALKLPEFSEYATKNGKGGGVYKVSVRPDLTRASAKTVVAPETPASDPVTNDENESLEAPLDTELEDRVHGKESPLAQQWARNVAPHVEESKAD